MSKPPFLISSRTGSELWQNTIQPPTITKLEISAKGLTAEEINAAEKLARAKVEEAAGPLKQYFLRQRQASDGGIAKWATHATKLGSAISVKYMRNHALEELHVRVDANVLLNQNPQYRTIKPLLTTEGWKVQLQSGFLNGESALEVDDPKRFRVQFEDSSNCGGPNGNTQKVSVDLVLKAVRGDWRVELKEYDGLAELQDPGYEHLDFFYTTPADSEPVYMLRADSRGGDAGCAMGEPVYEPGVKEVNIKENDEVTLTVYASTNDGRFHKKAFYELVLDWYPTTSDIVELISPE